MVEKLDQFYRAETELDSHGRERCAVDWYLPENQTKPFPILVWFHGGGLEEGSRNGECTRAFARRFVEAGIGVAMAGYRLAPNVKYPVYLEDAAGAVHWVMEQAAGMGSNPKMVYVGGHSAGGYLVAMLAMDESYLKKAGTPLMNVAGFIPMSAQMMTHFNIRKERGVADSQSKVGADEAAPIFHLRKETPPILLILGDNDWPARVEENRYFMAVLKKIAGNEKISLRVVPDRDHGTIFEECLKPGDPAGQAMLEFMKG